MKTQQHLVSYNKWLNSKENLLNRYFDLGSFNSVETKLVQEMHDEPLVSLVIETIGVVNRELRKGQYFYSDIKREGVLLYNNGEFELFFL